ncbi:glycogen synthase kinase, putative [Theileria annulata]|uniref:Glycogen synthase kinase, putative n=1 Tax=Theileria annulata TaxID=5874 RepID=Q4UD13_THEAN|nr:glycogen synthase kinase, putative [Theileria annulata]CAI75288.1 glycogen synthase kinase, putative [Theileria annulata]|eukprot:XP_954764.1 glycogen synthase kinase, putative [Theileria annulata]
MIAELNNNTDHESWYRLNKVIGNGSFGIVHEAYLIKTNEQVAIKKVLQDPRYKNRELTIMKDLRHPNIIKLRDYYFTVQYNNSTSSTTPSNNQTKTTAKTNGEEKYLNLVMEYMPDTVHKVMRTYFKSLGFVPLNLIRTYAFQICRAFGYLHSMNICHRDLKPHNLLVDPFTNVLKLCDFGSAKKLVKGDWSVSYICSRFYRAPELMLGSNEYTTAIDSWSIGCVLSELLLGRPIFCGDTSIDQLVKIIQILGTPSIPEMKAMNPDYNNINFPNLKRVELSTVFPKNTDPDLINLISNLLKYDPTERLKPLDALTHVFFKPLIVKSSNHVTNCTSSREHPNSMNSGILDELIVDIINPNLVPNNLVDFTPEECNYMSTRTKEYFNLI